MIDRVGDVKRTTICASSCLYYCKQDRNIIKLFSRKILFDNRLNSKIFKLSIFYPLLYFHIYLYSISTFKNRFIPIPLSINKNE